MRRLLLLAVLLAASSSALASAAETIAHGRFPKVVLHAPGTAVARFVILLSDADGWTAQNDALAAALAADGALVAGIDTPALLAALGDDCANAVGDVENLAHFVQGYRRLPAYFTPIVVGLGSGAAFARSTLAQAPPGLFAGLVTLDDCAAAASACSTGADAVGSESEAPAVPSRALMRASSRCARQTAPASRLAAPEEIADAKLPATLREAVRDLTPRAPQAAIDGLPLVEVPAAHPGTRCALLLSGDGGWAGLDEALAAALAARGLPVVGFDSLRYFWAARTPAGLAADLDRILTTYAARWHCTGIVLIGYSQGADVLPFATNRLPPTTRRLVSDLVLLGPGKRASFEFHLESWLARDEDGLPLAPELAQLSAREVLCVYGRDDEDAICPRLPASQARVLALPGDHHFDGDYATLAARVLASLAHGDAPPMPGRPSLAPTAR